MLLLAYAAAIPITSEDRSTGLVCHLPDSFSTFAHSTEWPIEFEEDLEGVGEAVQPELADIRRTGRADSGGTQGPVSGREQGTTSIGVSPWKRGTTPTRPRTTMSRATSSASDVTRWVTTRGNAMHPREGRMAECEAAVEAGEDQSIRSRVNISQGRKEPTTPMVSCNGSLWGARPTARPTTIGHDHHPRPTWEVGWRVLGQRGRGNEPPHNHKRKAKQKS